MSYYIIPKINSNIMVKPKYSNELCKPYISSSLLYYYNQIKNQIIDMIGNIDISNNNFDDAIKIINPYEFIFSKVPGSKFSVSKLKPKTNLFYDLLEIYNNLNIFESYKAHSIQTLHISPNYSDSVDCFEILRENYHDTMLFLKKYNFDSSIIDATKLDFIFYETDYNNYFYSIIEILAIILKNQAYKGTSIIKIGEIFHKPVIDALYFLTSLYEKVHICKSSTNNITSFDKYIVCKNFLHNEDSKLYLKLNYYTLLVFIKNLDNKNITQILDFNIPFYFKNKIDELNIIIGQQQIEALDQIVLLYKNKNKDDKIEIIKKNNIQKSVTWCEKFKIPCNKFTEKTNIFLPIINEITI